MTPPAAVTRRTACLWLAACLLASTASSARGQLTEPGICPFSTPQLDWDEAQFSAGPWYEIKAFPLMGLHDADLECTTWHFDPLDEGRGLGARVQYRARDRDDAVRALVQYAGQETQPRFNLTFDNIVGGPRSMEVKVVASDFNDFALLWGCTEPNLFERRVVSWVLSRQPSLSENAQDAIARLYRRHDIRGDKFVHTPHTRCNHPGYPASAFQDAAVARSSSPFTSSHDRDDLRVTYGVEEDVARQPSKDALRVEGEVEPASSSSSGVLADEDSADSVSWSHVGDVMSSQMLLMGALLAFCAVSLLASLLAFRALLQRNSKAPVLPRTRQDVFGQDGVQHMSKIGAGVIDCSRFGGLVQTRKPSNSAQPRLHM